MSSLKPSCKRKNRLCSLVLILVFTLTAGATPRKESQETPRKTPTEQQSRPQRIQLPDDKVAVQAIYPDQKPVQSTSIKVWDPEENTFTWMGKADEEGNFEIPELDAGEYLLIVAERVAIPIETGIESADSEGPFFVLVPHGKSQFAELSARAQGRALTQFQIEEEEEEDDDDKGLLWWFLGEEGPVGIMRGLMQSRAFWATAGTLTAGSLMLYKADQKEDDTEQIASPFF